MVRDHGALGQVLPVEPVGVLVAGPLPGRVGVGEVDRHARGQEIFVCWAISLPWSHASDAFIIWGSSLTCSMTASAVGSACLDLSCATWSGICGV